VDQLDRQQRPAGDNNSSDLSALHTAAGSSQLWAQEELQAATSSEASREPARCTVNEGSVIRTAMQERSADEGGDSNQQTDGSEAEQTNSDPQSIGFDDSSVD
jgi:hypothetical protein